ncbi:MAG: DUF2142 domain-containing protein [Chloroflexota bacterium]|nr:DUF2142 domain-containing protein [Chloroflexota bacterium]
MIQSGELSENPMLVSLTEKRLCLTILLLYLVAGALFAIYTPAWQLPDEPAHYNYIRQLVEDGCCPRIEAGDWSSEYLAQLTSSRFAPKFLDELASIQYEDHHPPLYYMLASLVYRLTAGDLIALRLFSLTLGAGVVALSYLISRRLLPAQPQVALGVMALVAFLPQHLHMLSAVNNDALAELLVGLTLLWLLRYLDGEHALVWQLGILVGLALLTKLTIYFLALLAPLAIWLRWRQTHAAPRALLRSLAVCAAIALLIGGVWQLRNISVYGFPDLLGLAAHDAVVADQPRTADFIRAQGAGPYLAQMLGTTFKSFWGQFGWMALPLDDVLGGWIYRGFALLTLLGVSGALASGRRQPAAAGRLILLAALLAVLLQFGYYNLEFQQWQGRYLFPALIPIACALVCGLDWWRARLLSRMDAARWLIPLALSSLFVLDLYLLARVIVPGLSP